jgi:spore coat polysaccharide biosynthesis protein SpsF
VSRLAFVQARTGSTRFPGKVVEPILGRPMFEWVVERVAAARGLDGVVVLIPENDETLRRLCSERGIDHFAGSEADVLDRYHSAAESYRADELVRITADCPLVDPEVVSNLIALYEGRQVEYASVATGAIPARPSLNRYPDGLDAEILSAEVLSAAWGEARDPFEREHVTPFVWRRPERFTLAVLEAETDLGEERWTVDHPEDLAFVRAVYERLNGGPFGYREVAALLTREPELRTLNATRRSDAAGRQ